MIVPLDGAGWTVREALGESWRWYVDAPPEQWRNSVAVVAARPAPGWRPATVPGSVVADLAAAGELPDPYRARNSRSAEWTGARSWVHRRTVTVRELAPDDRVVLEADGIDPAGTVYWDGEQLGRVPGLYRRARFEVPAVPGEHRLAVVVEPVPVNQPQVGRTELVRVHRPRMNEGWDFCPRFPHQGIWRALRLVVAATHVHGISVRADLDDDGTGRVTLDATVEGRPADYRLAVHHPGGGSSVRGGSVSPGGVRFELPVDDPQLWWPRGYGDQALHAVRLDVGGRPVWRGHVGFRRAALVANAGAPRDALGYTAVVNGTAVPLIGWNWVPADAQYGAVDPARVRHLVDLAARSGAQVLRVWGGGLLETPEFYDACDRAGLLVWQEFSQSSSGMQSAPATDADFVALMRDEAAAVVPPRTHHPSLLLWCGGNELDEDGVPLTDARSPVLAALHEQVRALDPGRAWLPTSPSGPAFHHRADVIAAAPQDQHDVHGPWEHQGLREQYALADAGTNLAHTEFGVEGMANRRQLERLVPSAERWPADRSNPVYRHLGDWWINEPLVQQAFGHRLHDLDALRRASQLLQATGLAYAVEADRRRWPRCSAVLPWQLDESYPNAWCTSCVGHDGEPKPAYHAVRRAFAARRVTARVPTAAWADEPELTVEAWLWSRSEIAGGSTVTAQLRDTAGAVLGSSTWGVPDPVCDPRPVGTLRVSAGDVPADELVVWDLTWQAGDGAVLDREIVLAATGADLGPLLDLPAAELAVAADASGVTVRHRGGPLVVGLQLLDDRVEDAAGWIVAEGDPRPLLPGGTRRFAVHGTGTDGALPVLVDAWNTRAVRVVVGGSVGAGDDPA